MKKPIFFLIFKILGALGVGIAIFGIVLAITGFGDFESDNFMIGGILLPVGMMIGVPCLINGFRPEIAKMSTQSTRYIQQENQEDLTAIADTTAEIVEGAVTRTASAVSEGLSQQTVFCKHCGAKIDADSKFCSACGKEL